MFVSMTNSVASIIILNKGTEDTVQLCSQTLQVAEFERNLFVSFLE